MDTLASVTHFRYVHRLQLCCALSRRFLLLYAVNR